MKRLKVTKNKTAILDNEDYLRLRVHRWHAYWDGYNFYVVRTDRTTGKKINISMHHSVVGKPPKGMHVDHINGNGLDNRKENLRIVTIAQNQWNTKTRKDNVSGQKGVSFVKKEKKWIVHIQANKKRQYLGYFSDKIEAIKAYKKAEEILHQGIERRKEVTKETKT